MHSKLHVIITGATGMVGEGILQECIANPAVEKILLINRKPSGYSNPKIEEVIHADLSDISVIADKTKGYDACYFCVGVSAVGMTEGEYTQVTYDLTLGFAKTLTEVNPKMIFCYISGGGTDSSEKGKQMWARVKGKTENDLMKLELEVYNFRPGFMGSFKGAKNVKGFYKLISALFPFFRLFSKSYFLTLAEVGKAMIQVTLNGHTKNILEVKDIRLLSQY